jgi:hypothetical protein
VRNQNMRIVIAMAYWQPSAADGGYSFSFMIPAERMVEIMVPNPSEPGGTLPKVSGLLHGLRQLRRRVRPIFNATLQPPCRRFRGRDRAPGVPVSNTPPRPDADGAPPDSSCGVPAETLGRLIEQRLSSPEMAELTSHLASCERCRWVVAQLARRSGRAVHDTAGHPPGPPVSGRHQ